MEELRSSLDPSGLAGHGCCALCTAAVPVKSFGPNPPRELGSRYGYSRYYTATVKLADAQYQRYHRSDGDVSTWRFAPWCPRFPCCSRRATTLAPAPP